ncbi:low molecular weight protein-tyrosine-phosphatase [Corynebacterium sp. A21]|uniref:low molecular weight protein-tyrosine-phosphatase n=1 Tax=Corynebacterium sp. A21 TaxID=3457318 RepID=UPI003FD0822A
MSDAFGEDQRYHISFICTGNICRSPMAAVIIAEAVEAAGLDAFVKVDSCGIGGWHVGQKADKRALAELRTAGYDGSEHRASQFGPDHVTADLLIALDTGHRAELIARGASAEQIRLLRSFDPAAPEEASIEDPYYGGPEGFAETRHLIEAAKPGLITWLREHADLREVVKEG